MEISNEEYLKIRYQEIDRLEEKYDFNSVDGIRSIPVPCVEVNPSDSPTGRVEYYLRGLCFRKHWDNGRVDVAIEALKKAQDLMFISDMIWKYDDFFRLVSYLHEAGRHREADYEADRIEAHFKKVGFYPKMHLWDFKSLKEYSAWKKNVQVFEGERLRKKKLRSEFYWFQEHAPELCPGTLSAYSRIKATKSKKYQNMCVFAKENGMALSD